MTNLITRLESADAVSEFEAAYPDRIQPGRVIEAEDNADLPTIAYLAGSADARDRLAALQAHADALAKYAVHQPDCRIGKPDCLGEEELCTCGLSNAIRAYEESRRG